MRVSLSKIGVLETAHFVEWYEVVGWREKIVCLLLSVLFDSTSQIDAVSHFLRHLPNSLTPYLPFQGIQNPAGL